MITNKRFSQLIFPESGSTYDLNHLLSSLLNKKISKRITSLTAIKSMLIYKDFKWEDLTEFKMKPPYIPKGLREWNNNLQNLSSSRQAAGSIS